MPSRPHGGLAMHEACPDSAWEACPDTVWKAGPDNVWKGGPDSVWDNCLEFTSILDFCVQGQNFSIPKILGDLIFVILSRRFFFIPPPR